MKVPELKIKVIVTILLLAGWMTPAFLSAQDIAGTWHGKLTIPTGSLTIVFHINATPEGGYTTSCDSPDQGVTNIKTETTTFQDSVLMIQIPSIHASYKGKLVSSSLINGIFTQGLPLTLNLEKGVAARPNRPQEPRPPYSYKSEDVSIKNEQDGITLAGTLTLPQTGSSFPAVVLITGSGAQNRDEEIMGHKPFLVIADYLTRHGIAVLRCDDRGTAFSQGIYATATNEDFVRDAEAAFNYLRLRKEINHKKIGIIGHSCGGTVAFCLGAQNSKIAFIISLAGAAVQGNSLMLKQVEAISKSQGMTDTMWQTMKPTIRNRYNILLQTNKTPEEIRTELYADVTKVMPPEALKDLNTVLRISAEINSMTSPWYLQFMRYDPTNDLKKIKCPVLALNGEKDIQIDAEINLNAIRQRITENGNKNVTVKAYPNLNHLFQTCSAGTIAEYGQLEETINLKILKDMAEWILKQTK